MSSERVGDRTTDRAAGWLGIGFLVLLLLGEAALSLPDEHAAASDVASFYAAHRAVIVVLQILGFVASVLLGLVAWRLRAIGPGVAGAGILLAVASLVPGIVTLVLALIADPARPSAAGALNRWEPRGDDVLFVGVTLFAATLLAFLGRPPRWLGILAALVAVCCLVRFGRELLGRSGGVADILAPVSFLVLVAALIVLCFRGLPRLPRPA
jgi:hypothetical protein